MGPAMISVEISLFNKLEISKSTDIFPLIKHYIPVPASSESDLIQNNFFKKWTTVGNFNSVHEKLVKLINTCNHAGTKISNFMYI